MRVGISSTEGVKSCINNFAKLLRKSEELTTIDLNTLAVEVETTAKRLAPFKTGRLERGVYARVSKDAKRPGIRAGAVAMNKGVNYAPIQHENEDFIHPIKGEAKFVLKALQQCIPKYIERAKRKVNSFE